MAEWDEAVGSLKDLQESDIYSFSSNRSYTKNALITLLEIIASCTAKLQPGNRASSCIVKEDLMIKLLEESDISYQTPQELEYYHNRRWYITALPFRVSREELAEAEVWSLIVSERRTDERFNHRFYSTYGEAREHELIARAKWYALKIEKFFTNDSDYEPRQEDIRFEIIKCYRQNINKASGAWLIEFLRFDLKDRFVIEPWISSYAVDPNIIPSKFKVEYIRMRRVATWLPFIKKLATDSGIKNLTI